MLNDFGIQHFHLGTEMDSRRPSLIKGTKEVLFALVTDDDFYAIGIYSHDAWSKQELLDIVEQNWPQLIEPYTAKGVIGVSHQHTDEEIKLLRDAGINVLTQGASGSVRMGMGGGISGAGTSIAVTRQTDSLMLYVGNVQDAAMVELAKIGAPDDLELRLSWVGDAATITSEPAGWTAKTGLVIPQL